MKVLSAGAVVFLVQIVLVSCGNDYNNGGDYTDDCAYLWMMMQNSSGFPVAGLGPLLLVCLSITALAASTLLTAT